MWYGSYSPDLGDVTPGQGENTHIALLALSYVILQVWNEYTDYSIRTMARARTGLKSQ